MSKSDGLKIGIKFTEDLIGDYATPESGYEELKYDNYIKSIAYSNQYSSTYSAKLLMIVQALIGDVTLALMDTDRLNNPIA